ncbi:MAG: hypothetical protein ACI4DY_13545 [Monoglobaceae bacterium]
MRKLYAAAVCAALLLLCLPSYAAEGSFETPVVFCCGGDAIGVDLIYSVSGGAKITNVVCDLDGINLDWNYIEAEQRLYIAVASASPIPKAEKIAHIITEGAAEFAITSVLVDGKVNSGAHTAHTAAEIPTVPPTCDKAGHTGGLQCENCGYVMSEPQTIPPTGPVIRATVSASGVVSVSGAISDNDAAECMTLLAVYDGEGRVTAAADITAENQSALDLNFGGCLGARTVKIFRWDAKALTPMYSPIEVKVIQDAD